MTGTYAEGQREFTEWLHGQGVELVEIISHGQLTDDEGWAHYAYTVRIRNRKARSGLLFAFDYRMGVANPEPPTLGLVMAAYCNDAMDFANHDGWEDYAREFEIGDLDYVSWGRIKRYKSMWTAMGRVAHRIDKLLPGVDLAETVAPMIEEAGW